ncbi:chorismate--pyruvate lyase family protein [Alteromonas aestuariivivens]|uniref:chorismate--pyruvate lyase family protein n=1 Tax=Alteromonas aestuariivivens TaxID=1938339 RepID=UPI001FE77E1F|nr:chorismate lyase [Alteromonas aestuariivivens]
MPEEFPVGLDADWQAPGSVKIDCPYLKNWLLDTGSLTERLQSLCRHFELKLIGQKKQPLHTSEANWLNSSVPGEYQVREVVLMGDGAPWVFARSVIPEALIQSELGGLGCQPLGQRLFNDPRFRRGGFEVCRIPAQQWLNTQQPETLWGRRSRFYFDNLSMIVAEVFLPAAPVYNQE